jgi:hypothetical protein
MATITFSLYTLTDSPPVQDEGGNGLVCLIQNVSVVTLLTMTIRISFSHWEFVSEFPTAVRGGAGPLTGSNRMGDGRIVLKTSAPHSLMTTYRIKLLSARSVSLDSAFKRVKSLSIAAFRK